MHECYESIPTEPIALWCDKNKMTGRGRSSFRSSFQKIHMQVEEAHEWRADSSLCANKTRVSHSEGFRCWTSPLHVPEGCMGVLWRGLAPSAQTRLIGTLSSSCGPASNVTTLLWTKHSKAFLFELYFPSSSRVLNKCWFQDFFHFQKYIFNSGSCFPDDKYNTSSVFVSLFRVKVHISQSHLFN